MLLKNAVVYNEDFEPIRADLAVEGEKIAGIGQVNAGGECLDLSGYTIIPGLIDMHIHGCAGFDASDGTPEALEAMSRCLVERGITSFCPTSMTLSFEALQKIFANVQEQKDKVTGAYIHGINMEGPYIAMSKKGAQNGAYVRNPDKEEFRRLYDGCGGCVSIVDIAPECDGAEAVHQGSPALLPGVHRPTRRPGYDQAVQAIEWGVRHTTHLYNAMSGLTHRAPGVVGAVFDMARQYGVRGELICDGLPHPSRGAAHRVPSAGRGWLGYCQRFHARRRPCGRGIRPGRADRICQGRQGPAGGRHHRRLHFQPV